MKQEEHKEQEENISNKQQEMIKELKLGIAGLDTINPILSKNKNVQDISKLIYEPLVNLTSDYKAESCLAKEWAKKKCTLCLGCVHRCPKNAIAYTEKTKGHGQYY